MTWKDDINHGLAAFGLKIPDSVPLDALAPKLASAPLRNSAAVIAVSSAAFLAAERGHNPKVNDIYDAMLYCSTCLSVGYADIFPRTPVGKLIGTVLMTVGPALVARGLDGQSQGENVGRAEALQQQILGTLQQILTRLPVPTAEATVESTTPPAASP